MPEGGFGDRLRGVVRVGIGAADEQQPLDTRCKRRPQHGTLNGEVVLEEPDGVCEVRCESPDASGDENEHIGVGCRDGRSRRVRVSEVEVQVLRVHEFNIRQAPERAAQSSADQASMAGDVDASGHVPEPPLTGTECPASASTRSCLASSKSLSTISWTSSSSPTLGSQPSTERALVGSPCRASTSDGRK